MLADTLQFNGFGPGRGTGSANDVDQIPVTIDQETAAFASIRAGNDRVDLGLNHLDPSDRLGRGPVCADDHIDQHPIGVGQGVVTGGQDGGGHSEPSLQLPRS